MAPTTHFDPTQAGAQITRDNQHWGTILGAPSGPISYGFRQSPPTYNSSANEQVSFSQVTTGEKAVAETALPGFDSETWFGIVAPAGTPHDIRGKLNAAALKALVSDDTKKRYLDLGMVTRSSSPEEFDAYIKAEVGKWSGVIKEANVQALD